MFNKVCAIAVYLTILGAGAVMFSVVYSSTTNAQGGPPSWSGHDYWMPGWMHRHMWGRRGRSPEMRARRQRHWTFMHDGLPEEYERARSTIKIDKAAIDEGRQLYAQNCASCHGRTGDGDGEAAKSLTPSPALLSFMIQRPIAVDPYLLWTISEGGKQFGTDMPAFKENLSREQIWQIIAYMRAGFSDVEKSE